MLIIKVTILGGIQSFSLCRLTRGDNVSWRNDEIIGNFSETICLQWSFIQSRRMYVRLAPLYLAHYHSLSCVVHCYIPFAGSRYNFCAKSLSNQGKVYSWLFFVTPVENYNSNKIHTIKFVCDVIHLKLVLRNWRYITYFDNFLLRRLYTEFYFLLSHAIRSWRNGLNLSYSILSSLRS